MGTECGFLEKQPGSVCHTREGGYPRLPISLVPAVIYPLEDRGGIELSIRWILVFTGMTVSWNTWSGEFYLAKIVEFFPSIDITVHRY